MSGFMKQMFIILVLLLLGFCGSLAIKCMSINNQPCMVRPILSNLNPDKLHYYPFIVSMTRCDGSCITAEDLFSRICLPNKIESMNKGMIRRTNESKALAKHISCECRCKFDGRKYNTSQKWNNDKCWCEFKKPIRHPTCEKDCTWNPSICTCECDKDFETGKYMKD